jgi:3-oxoacyl-[acyl-carrier protein] reductase
MFDFSGRVLWLTGANGAISRSIAKVFFDLGATCVLTDLDEDGVIDFAATLDPSGKRSFGLKQDTTKSGSCCRQLHSAKLRQVGFPRDKCWSLP